MAKKRANGEGNIRKRKDGRWEGRYTAGYDSKTGKRLIKNVLGKTQAEVKEKLKIALEETNGLDVSKAADVYTVASWLRTWYELYAKPNIRLNHFYPFGVWVKMWGKHLTHTKNQNLQQKILKNRSFRGFLELLGGFEPPTSSLPRMRSTD